MPKSKRSRAVGRPETFGEALTMYRNRTGLSLAAVAESVGMTHAWLSHLETGRRTVRNEVDVHTLAQALRVVPTKLISEWRRLVGNDLRKSGGLRPAVVRQPVSFPSITNQQEAGSDLGQQTEAVDDIDIGQLLDAIRNDPTAREVAQALCAAYARTSGE